MEKKETTKKNSLTKKTNSTKRINTNQKDTATKDKKIKKEAKVEEPKKLEPLQNEDAQTMKKFGIVLLVVICGVIVIYLFTRAFISKDLFSDSDSDEATQITFNYDITILGSTFNRPYSHYYVVAYSSSSDDAYTLSTAINTYVYSDDPLKLYYADLDEFFNESFYDPDNVTPNATSAKELKVGDYTLIEIEDGKIVSFVQGVDEITEVLEVEEEE